MIVPWTRLARPGRRPRSLVLTAKGRDAIGIGPAPTVAHVGVPLLVIPFRPDHKDRR